MNNSTDSSRALFGMPRTRSSHRGRIEAVLLYVSLIGLFPFSASAQTPANDAFTNAQLITGVFSTVASSNANATLEAAEPTVTAGRTSGKSVWYRWVAPAAATYTFSVSAAFDSQLAVFTGNSVGALTLVSSSDLPGAEGDSLNLSVMEGESRMFRISGYQSQEGAFKFTLAAAPFYEKLHSFTEAWDSAVRYSGADPKNGLIQGLDGNYYGTTDSGGTNSSGTIFKLTPNGVMTTLVNFTGTSGDFRGISPSSLVQGGDGNLYGTTYYGGERLADFSFEPFELLGCGTIFRLTPSGAFTTLFTGSFPAYVGPGELLKGANGNLYGTFASYWTPGSSFKVAPSGAVSIVAQFANGEDRLKNPYSEIDRIKDSAGNCYGTTYSGGAGFLGTIFKITPAGVITTLIEFTGTGGDYKGSNPGALLTKGLDGNFYGTTSKGGAADKGTVFRITPQGVFTTLVEFTGITGNAKGDLPVARLLQDTDGIFYGSTQYGGMYDASNARGYGTIFKMTPTGVLTTLVEFTGTGNSNKGKWPSGSLLKGSDGNLLGTTQQGGSKDFGTVFKMTPAGALTTLVEFEGYSQPDTGQYPMAELARDGEGNLYGTTYSGGNERLWHRLQDGTRRRGGDARGFQWHGHA